MAANGAAPPAGGAAAAAPDQGGNSAKLRRALVAKGFSEDHFIIPNMWHVRSNVPGDYEPCQYMPNVLVSEWRDRAKQGADRRVEEANAGRDARTGVEF